MARVVLCMGGNLGDVKSRFQIAQQQINNRIGPVLRCSHRYTSPAWGFASDQLFSNQVIEADTDLTPEEVLDTVQQIEIMLGRKREEEQAEKTRTGARYCSRPIDIDILFYDDRIIRTARLHVPHPYIAEREFVLVPLCELMRNRRHPVTGETMGELLDRLRKNPPADE